MTQLEQIPLSQTIYKVDVLIDGGNGDPGRLQYIYDALSNNKLLYDSDANYLESKLRPTIKETIIVEPPKKPTIVIPKITKEIVESKLPQKPKDVLPKG